MFWDKVFWSDELYIYVYLLVYDYRVGFDFDFASNENASKKNYRHSMVYTTILLYKAYMPDWLDTYMYFLLTHP